MDPALEIRKLKPSHVQELTMILETHELWKRLMSVIPKNLHRFNYTCDLSISNPHKYNSDHFRIIETASIKTRKTCTEILFEEWGTSGRVLPAIGHLLYLLTKAKLFRAADYVAISLLNQPKPERPEQGPEASVALDSPKTLNLNKKTQEEEIEKILNGIDYPASAVEKIISLNVQNIPTKPKLTIPKIVITSNNENKCKSKENTKQSIVNESDLIKFSTNSIELQKTSNIIGENSTELCTTENNKIDEIPVIVNETVSTINSTQSELPEISKLLMSEKNETLPDLSLINNSIENTQNLYKESVNSITYCNPALSELLSEKNAQTCQGNVTYQSALINISDNIPNISALQLCNSKNISNEINSAISYSPHFSALQSDVDIVLSKNKSNNLSETDLDQRVIVPSLNSFNMNIPDFNALQSNSFTSNITMNSSDRETSSSDVSDSISHICPLGLGTSKTYSDEKVSNKSISSIESFIPDLGIETKSKAISVNVTSTDSNSRPCNSPLPQLSLNTQLPHFSYSDLTLATNNFNENLYIDEIASGRFLGSGAFGSVFLAFALFEKPVAVKKLVLENVDYVDIDATVTKQFKNEVEVLSHYKHPNLLSLVGYSCDGCTYCLLYEYIQGGALSVRLQARNNKLQWKERLKIAFGTAKAVAYLHTAFSTPLIHRDIKSANILLDCNNTPKLCDFGLIKLSPSQNTATATTVFGTSAYMAPEAFRGDISVKMDTFSFGVVLLELLTSLPPLDENREGTDLVTHVGENCEQDSISPLLDQDAGSWIADEINFDKELYKISMMCLEEKKKRPNMVIVRDQLSNLTKELFL